MFWYCQVTCYLHATVLEHQETSPRVSLASLTPEQTTERPEGPECQAKEPARRAGSRKPVSKNGQCDDSNRESQAPEGAVYYLDQAPGPAPYMVGRR